MIEHSSNFKISVYSNQKKVGLRIARQRDKWYKLFERSHEIKIVKTAKLVGLPLDAELKDIWTYVYPKYFIQFLLGLNITTFLIYVGIGMTFANENLSITTNLATINNTIFIDQIIGIFFFILSFFVVKRFLYQPIKNVNLIIKYIQSIRKSSFIQKILFSAHRCTISDKIKGRPNVF